MTKLKAIKKMFKKQSLWKQYKKKFVHRQMRLVCSKIALIYNPKLEASVLFENEMKLLKADKQEQEKMFSSAFANFPELTNMPNVNWDAFAAYMWYVYQTSTYWQDKKWKRSNVYNANNYIELNQAKRHYYNEWLKTIDLSSAGANDKIIKVQKAVF